MTEETKNDFIFINLATVLQTYPIKSSLQTQLRIKKLNHFVSVQPLSD